MDESKVVLDFLHTDRSNSKILALDGLFKTYSLDIENVIRKYYGSQFLGEDKSINKAELLIGFIRNIVTLTQYRYIKPIIDSPSLVFVRGQRTSEEYAIDIIIGWLLEDFILELLRYNGLEVDLCGVDSSRIFLSSRKGLKKVQVTADFIVKENGKGFDIKSDLKGTWELQKRVDIKEKSFQDMIDSKTALVCVDVVNARIRFLSKELLQIQGISSYGQWKFRNPSMDNKEMYGIPLQLVKVMQPPDLVKALK